MSKLANNEIQPNSLADNRIKAMPEVGDIVQETVKRGQYIRYFVLERFMGANKYYYMLLVPMKTKNETDNISALMITEKELKKLKYLGKSKMEFGNLFKTENE